MALRRLVYASRANVESATQVRVLVGHAQVRNRQGDVTGALGYTGRHFIQVLEGRHEVLTRLLASIEQDARHTAVTVLSDQPASRRLFGRWDMRLIESLDAADAIEALVATPSSRDKLDLRALFDQLAASVN